jgi:hypothetical protein
MTGPLENSVTLDDILAVVAAKRVPLAAELAGYLALEMAEGVGSGLGALEAPNVYVSDEGTVALVRARKDGDPEQSIRALLARLLEAGGTQTPALGLAAKKPPGSGSMALARELEAALIPVNRAAGRRALARLAREVKRVTHGVGRNASIPPAERGSRASHPSFSDARRPSAPGFSEEEVPTTAKRAVDAEVLAEGRRSEPSASETAPGREPAARAEEARPGLERPDSTELPTMELSGTDAARLRALPEAFRDSSRPPAAGVRAEPPSDAKRASPPPVRENSARPPDVDDLHAVEEAPKDEVDALLSTFGVSGEKEDKGLARELKAMVGVEPTPPPLGLSSPDDAGIDDLLSMSHESAVPPKVAPPPPRAPPARQGASAPTAAVPRTIGEDDPTPVPRSSRSSYADDRSLPTAPSQRRKAKPARKLSVLDIVLGLVIAMLLGAGGYLLAIRQWRPIAPTAPAPSAASVTAAPPDARACKASLTVENAPDKAEILLRVGQAPVEIDHMPVGTRLEFVATADAYAPKRAVVPAGSVWEKGPDGKPRYELAVQLDPSRAKGGLDPWPPAEPGSSAGGEGAPGTVRVVSSPKGAEVWILVGLGPEAHIDRLPCAGDTQVLVAGSGSVRKRLVVRESDFTNVAGAPGLKSARVSAR